MTAKIYESMIAIMADCDPIAKSKKNTQQNYAFRGIDDVYYTLQAVMAKHGVFSVPTVLSEKSEEKATKSGGTLIYRVLTIMYTFYAIDGSFVMATVIGEGMDSGDKASNKAMSVAHKYALLQAFCIPTNEPKDPEHANPEIDKHSPGDSNLVPKTEVYTGASKQQERVIKTLKNREIDDKFHLAIHEKLMYQPLSRLGEIVKEVTSGGENAATQ